MRKYLFAALVALCFAVPGTVNANPVESVEMVASPEMALHLVEAILRAAAERSEWTFSELERMYNEGVLTISKPEGDYLILFVESGGGLIIGIEEAI